MFDLPFEVGGQDYPLTAVRETSADTTFRQGDIE
jgi:hypothetical protein